MITKGVGSSVMKQEDGKTLPNASSLAVLITDNVRTAMDLGMKKHPGIPPCLREQAQERSQHWWGGRMQHLVVFN